jgi:DNA polymerase
VQKSNTVADATPADATPQAALAALVRDVRALAEFQAASGVRWVPLAAAPAAPARPSPPPAGVVKVAPRTADLFGLPGLDATASLAELRAFIGDCQRCKLAPGRTNLVFGIGNPRAALMFVGEGPGHDEDVQGEPFVGRAGQLLTEIITKGMKIARADVYIANVVKCRPPGNRNPEPDEVATCIPFLARQVQLIRPRVIVVLGSVAAQALLGTRTPITRMRGTWHEYEGIKVMPTFHPAYLLRNPADKKLVWEDIKQVMRELGLPQ